MAGSKAQRIPNVWERLRDQQKTINQQDAIGRRTFNPQTVSIPPSPETPPAGKSGSESGNALLTAGGTMIGAIAFFPKLISMTALVIGKPASATSNVLDISEGIAADTSRVILGGVDGASGAFDLEFIKGGQYAGQYLNIQGIVGNTITIKNDVSGNGSAGFNIRTQTSDDLLLIDNANIELIFDSTQNQWALISGGVSGGKQGLIASLSTDQLANFAIGQHIEYDTNSFTRNGLVVSTGVGQANGIVSGFLAGKSYSIRIGGAFRFAANTGSVTFQLKIETGTGLLISTEANGISVQATGQQESFLPTIEGFFEPSADTDTISVQFTSSVSVAAAISGATVGDPTTYLIIEDISSGGGSGGGGGSSSLSQLNDVSISPLPPIANDVLQFNTSSGLWENQPATAGGGMLTDMSNLQALAVPPVNLSLNGHSLINVDDVLMASAGSGIIDNVRILDFFQAGHSIQSDGDSMDFTIETSDAFLFVNGVNNSTVINNAGVRTDRIDFKTNGTISPTVYQINRDANSDMAFNVPDLQAFRWSTNNNETLRLTSGGLLTGLSSTWSISMQVQNSGISNPIDGEITRAGADVFIGSGGNDVNITDLFNNTNSGQFPDNTFAIFDNIDNSKVAQFDAAAIQTGVTRTYNFQDANGRIALLDGVQQNFTVSIDMANNAINDCGGLFTTGATSDIGDSSNYFDDMFIKQIFFFGDAALGYKIGGSVTDGFDFVVPNTNREFDFFFDGGTTPSWIIRPTVIDAMGGRLEDLEEIQFDGLSTITAPDSVRRIGYDNISFHANMPTAGQFRLYWNGTQEWVFDDDSLRGDIVFLDKSLFFADSSNAFPVVGQFSRAGSDIYVQTSSGIKNLDDIGGGAGGMETNLSNMSAPTVPTVNLAMNGQSITGVDDITMLSSGSLLNMNGGDILAADSIVMQNVSSFINMVGGRITNVIAPSADGDAANKKYVDDTATAGSVGTQDAELNLDHETAQYDRQMWISHAKQGDKDTDNTSPIFGTAPQEAIYFYPFFIAKRSRIIRIGTEVGTAVANDWSAAIYDSFPDQNYPRNRLGNSTNTFINQTGLNTILLSPAQDLEAGLYWIATWYDNGSVSTIRGFPAQCCNVAGWSTTTATGGAMIPVIAFVESGFVSSTLPSTAPTEMAPYTINVLPCCFALLEPNQS